MLWDILIEHFGRSLSLCNDFIIWVVFLLSYFNFKVLWLLKLLFIFVLLLDLWKLALHLFMNWGSEEDWSIIRLVFLVSSHNLTRFSRKQCLMQDFIVMIMSWRERIIENIRNHALTILHLMISDIFICQI